MLLISMPYMAQVAFHLLLLLLLPLLLLVLMLLPYMAQVAFHLVGVLALVVAGDRLLLTALARAADNNTNNTSTSSGYDN